MQVHRSFAVGCLSKSHRQHAFNSLPATSSHRARITTAQCLAIAAGIIASCGALYILLSDAIATGHYGMEHVLMPGIVGITIMSGHLIGNALRDRSVLSALGFLVLFAIGTTLTVYTSVGRQTESAETRAKETEDANATIADKRSELQRARKRHDEAQVQADRERGTSCGRRCQNWELRAKEVQAHHQA